MGTEEIRKIISEMLKEAGKSRTALLISHELSMTGAPMALLEMAEQLRELRITVVVTCTEDGSLRGELERRGVLAVIIPQLFEEGVLSDIADLFDFIVVNTLVCCPAVKELNGADIPVLWWIHETEEAYGNYTDIMPAVLLSNITAVTVGPRAGASLKKHRPLYEAEELLYAIPDFYTSGENRSMVKKADEEVVTFALIGTLLSRKGQDILLDAINTLDECDYDRSRFIFVGGDAGHPVTDRVRKAVSEEHSNIEYIEYISRDEMPAFYESIDCLICASRDDPMPIVVTEACMTGRAVICSENTGSAPLIERYNAGIICHNDDPEELASCIGQVIRGLSGMDDMRKNARKLYEENFTPEIFEERLRTVIDSITAGTAAGEADRIELDDTVREIINDYCNREQQKSIALKSELTELKADMDLTEKELLYYKDSFSEIENAFFWKASAPARFVLDAAKGVHREIVTTGMIRKGLRNIRENGVVDTMHKVYRKLRGAATYRKWMKTPLFTDAELAEQRNHVFSKDIVFSITVPLYNTPETFLREMIESVIDQTYGKWELCLADGSDSKHDYVGNVCKEYAARDKRILYRKLKRNQGISGNTNACLDMATGDYIALFDHDDILHPAALHEMMMVICEKDADIVYTDEAVFISPDIRKISSIHFKPDFAPDNLRANNYMCHFTAFKRSMLDRTGGFRSEYDGSQDHDMMLRLTEAADRIEHIPEVLYFWRAHPQSVASGIDAKGYAAVAGRKAVMDSLRRQGLEATVESTKVHPCIFRIRYALTDTPLVSIVIPNCDHIDELKICIDSILSRSTYRNYEIIIAENNSCESRTFDYYDQLTEKHDNIRVIIWEGEPNYSAINNYAVRNAVKGEYILLLNNDTEVITPSWIEEMLMFAQRGDVGAVGAMLFYPNDTIQGAGIILGLGGAAGHAYHRAKRGGDGYMGRLAYAQDMTAVTAACMLVRRDVWDEVGGLDEEFALSFNDVDLCMKIRREGYLIVWTPYAELYHYESASRGMDDTPEKKARFDSEAALFRSRWGTELKRGDPYYNPNLTLVRSDFSLRYTRQSGLLPEELKESEFDGAIE